VPGRHFNQQWLNANANRSYPLADWGTKTDQTGTIRIPDSFLLAFFLPVHAGLAVEPDKFYLKQLGIYPTGYNLTIGYDDGSSYPTVASVNIAKAAHAEFRTYAVPGSDDFDDTVGRIVIGKLDEIDELPPGLYTFAPAATPLDSDTVWPVIRGITALTVVNGSDRSDRIYGDVELVAQENMRITVVEIEGEPTQIQFSAISGEGLNESCVCDDAEEEGDPIRFINGIPPMTNGNFRMVGNDCVELEPIVNGLKFTDVCSSPCCGCESLNAIARQIDRFADGATTLQNFVGSLTSKVDTLTGVLLASKLNTGSCIEC
jgi:hypothetical protein